MTTFHRNGQPLKNISWAVIEDHYHWFSYLFIMKNEDGDGDADNNKVDEDNDDNDDNCDDVDILDDDDNENVAHSRPSLVVAPHPATSGLSPLKT